VIILKLGQRLDGIIIAKRERQIQRAIQVMVKGLRGVTSPRHGAAYQFG
jgi:hypothetical protein